MTDLPNHRPYASPFVSEAAPSMEEVIEQIDNLSDLSSTRQRDLKSAIRSFCRFIGKEPSEVPANINWLHVRIRRVHPAAHDISQKRLANIKSDVLKALALAGCSRSRGDWLRPPSAEWEKLLASVPDKHDRWKLSQFAQYCSALDVGPSAVTDKHVLGLLQVLIDETFADKPDQVALNAVKTWNRLHQQVAGWPEITLTRPPRKKEPWTTPLDRFPESFQEDVDNWLTRLEHPDPFNSSGPMKPLRPATVAHRRHQIQQMASALLLTGYPIENITSLAALVQVEAFKDGLRQLMSRFGDKPTEAIHGLAMGMKAIATHHVNVDEEHVNELRRICQRLNLNIDGLRIKNQERLQQLDDPHNLAKLLHLSDRLVRLSNRAGLRPHKAALLVQAALAIEILFYAPMRAGTLSRIHMEQHIRFIGAGRQRRTQITIPAQEMKNNRDLHYELGDGATRLLQRYLKEARPILLDVASDFLFPAMNGGPNVNGGAKLVHPGGAKLVHLTLCGTRCWGGCPGSP